MLSYPNIDPVALTLGPLKIHWYGISYVIGIMSAWYLLRQRVAGVQMYSRQQVDDIVFYFILGVIIGGRLGSVVFYNLPYYLDHPIDIFKLNQGGMSFHGGLIGVLIMVGLLARKTASNFFQITDFIAPVVPIGLGCGRIGNFINGELWGKPSDLPWAMIFPDSYAGSIARHPSQLYEAMLEGVVLFTILWFYSSKPRPLMATSGLFLIGYGIFRFSIEFVREPDRHIGYLANGWLTMGQVLCMPMIVVGIILFVIAYTKVIDKR